MKVRKFDKEILKDGMFIETKDFCVGIYIKGFIFFSGAVYSVSDDYYTDGTFWDRNRNQNDIISIYELPDNFKGEDEIEDLDELFNTPEILEVIWERGVEYNQTFNPTEDITVSPVLKSGYFDVEEGSVCLEIKKQLVGGSYNFMCFTEEEVRGLANALNEWVSDVDNLRE